MGKVETRTMGGREEGRDSDIRIFLVSGAPSLAAVSVSVCWVCDWRGKEQLQVNYKYKIQSYTSIACIYMYMYRSDARYKANAVAFSCKCVCLLV